MDRGTKTELHESFRAWLKICYETDVILEHEKGFTELTKSSGGAGPPWFRANGTTSAESDHAESSDEESPDEVELRTAKLFAGMSEARAALDRIYQSARSWRSSAFFSSCAHMV